VMWMVLGESLVICAIGIAAGLPLAVGTSRLLRSMFFGLEATDPLSFAVALAAIVAVALAAALVPARRAVRIDPMVALRAE
jgi:ABC-type antimicrobial peptide transport system permease subunit